MKITLLLLSLGLIQVSRAIEPVSWCNFVFGGSRVALTLPVQIDGDLNPLEIQRGRFGRGLYILGPSPLNTPTTYSSSATIFLNMNSRETHWLVGLLQHLKKEDVPLKFLFFSEHIPVQVKVWAQGYAETLYFYAKPENTHIRIRNNVWLVSHLLHGVRKYGFTHMAHFLEH